MDDLPQVNCFDVDACQLAEDEAAHSTLVANALSGVMHAVLDTDGSGTPQRGMSRCQWQFTLGANARTVTALPVSHKMLCERCFPVLRGWRKFRAEHFNEGSS